MSHGEVATAAELGAQVFANEVMVTNLGILSFDRQFGPVTLKALFGPAVLTGFEGQQTIDVATVNGALCLLHTGHTPQERMQKVQTDATTWEQDKPKVVQIVTALEKAGDIQRARAIHDASR